MFSVLNWPCNPSWISTADWKRAMEHLSAESHGHKEARGETGSAVGASHSAAPNEDTHRSTQSPHRVPQPQNQGKYKSLLPPPSSLGLWASSRSHKREDCEAYLTADLNIKQAILFCLALQTMKKMVALLRVVLHILLLTC